ncbi:MAG: FkbM family methyltransferase [Acidimicrobiales bacterium]
MHLSLYNLKNLALTPRRAYRRRTDPETDAGLRQLFYDRYYRRPLYRWLNATVRNPKMLTDLPVDSTAVVVDVGAYRGEWAEPMWDAYQPTIHCFEPAPFACRKLRRAFAGNDKVHVHQYGLGGADATAALSLSGPGSSLFDGSAEFEHIDVPIRDVVTVLEELGLDRVDVLKVNIEGGEYDLLDRLEEADWLSRIGIVLVQFHEWHPKAYGRRRRNRRALARTHEETWCYPWVWECWSLRPAGTRSSAG